MLLLALFLAPVVVVRAEFDYPDFPKNEVPSGLVFKGNTSQVWCNKECADIIPNGTLRWYDAWSPTQTCSWYAENHPTRCNRYGKHYRNFGYTASQICCICGGGYIFDNTTKPETTRIYTDSTDHMRVQLSELDPEYVRDCKPALRLTEPRPDQTSAVWHETRQTVYDGFETRFTFRISNRSKYCDQAVKKNDAKLELFKVCKDNASPILHSKLEGGDGFAFVIQNSENGTDALGDGAGGLGFTGMRNSLAIEFDSFSNPGEPPFQHISVRAAGLGQLNNAYRTSSWQERESIGRVRHTSAETELAPAVAAKFADANEHTARIVLWRGVKDEYFDKFGATQHLSRFVHGDVMTLCVFLDDLVNPLQCLPINLQAMMPLINNQAIVGFTATTGRQWQAHDILSWKFCESGTC